MSPRPLENLRLADDAAEICILGFNECEMHVARKLSSDDDGSVPRTSRTGLQANYLSEVGEPMCNGTFSLSSEYINSRSYCIYMAFVTQIGQFSGLLGVTLDVRPLDIPVKTQVLDDDEQRAVAVVAAEECTHNGVLE
ncbi:hypothetical protein BDD12DRAFT_803407 [Trichophaea hybrida]|nr:hypothetical protein BDD12DRAFT_803407 [Trichophaea hybrida]